MDDLGKKQRDYAVYLPAVSSFYTKQLDKICNKVPEKSRVPVGFEHGNEGLDFFKDERSSKVRQLFPIYNRIFGTNQHNTRCSSCVNKVKNALNKLINSYK